MIYMLGLIAFCICYLPLGHFEILFVNDFKLFNWLNLQQKIIKYKHCIHGPVFTASYKIILYCNLLHSLIKSLDYLY